MYQVVYRRFAGRLADRMSVPDLLLIDGGKGQLSAARRALEDAGVELPLLGLAKKQETIIREVGEPILVPETHPALRLLIAIRDEAHRTAVGYNRKRRGQAMTRSILDDVPGIGPKRRDALLAHFSSIDQLKAADVGELASIPGMGASAAEAVKAFFQSGEP
jgi:excinuclease ABC subunit C